MKSRNIITLFILSTLGVSCSSIDSSNYELDRRSGFEVHQDKDKKEDQEKIARIESGLKEVKYEDMPTRTPALIEKVWVFDQQLEGGHWLKGTSIFIEVENSKWKI